MNNKPDVEFDTLSFTNVRFHFIYSFLLDMKELSPEKVMKKFEDAGLTKGFPWSRKGLLPIIRAQTIPFFQAFTYFDSKLTIKDRYDKFHTYDEYFSDLVNIVNYADRARKYKQCKIGRLLRLHATGGGTFTVSVEVEDRKSGIPFVELEPLVRLVSRTWAQDEYDKIPEESGETQEGFLFGFSPSIVNKNEFCTLDDLFCHIMKWLQKNLEAEPLFPQILRKSDSNDLHEMFKRMQIPYLFIDATVSEKLHRFYFVEGPENYDILATRRPKILKQIAALLLRSFDLKSFDRISTDFIKSELNICKTFDPQFLVPANINSNLFVYIYKSASISICHQRKALPANFMIPSLLDILEVTRLRWHSLTVTNLVMDHFLAEISSLETIEDTILKLERFKTILGAQLCQPHIFLHSGQCDYDAMQVALKCFRVEELLNPLYQKLSLLDLLISRREYIDVIERLESEKKKAKDKKATKETLGDDIPPKKDIDRVNYEIEEQDLEE